MVAACVPGVAPEQWEAVAALSIEGTTLARAAGIHPAHAHEAEVDALVAFASTRPLDAIGELGWHRGVEADLARQDAVADAQLELARGLERPVILHVVGLHGHALDRLARHAPLRGVIHGYSGSAALVDRYVALGLSIGIGPSVLRAGARRPREAARRVPAQRLLIETDAPDQAAPVGLVDVLAAVADARGEAPEALAAATFSNASALYGVG